MVCESIYTALKDVGGGCRPFAGIPTAFFQSQRELTLLTAEAPVFILCDPSMAVGTALRKSSRDFKVAYRGEPFFARGVRFPLAELYRSRAVQADYSQQRKGVVGRDAGIGCDFSPGGRVFRQKAPQVGGNDLVAIRCGGKRHG